MRRTNPMTRLPGETPIMNKPEPTTEAATIEELQARIAKLEGSTASQPQRMVPLGGGFLDANGNPVMVPYVGEELGDRLQRQEFDARTRALHPERELDEPYEPDPNFVPSSPGRPS